jgi:predicted ATPase
VLSFGPEAQALEFEPLNVLIGPNGSGKSNLLDVLRLLRSLPTDLRKFINESGTIKNWIWRSGADGKGAEIESEWHNWTNRPTIRHRFVIGQGRPVQVLEETINGLPELSKIEYRYKKLGGKRLGPELLDYGAERVVAMDTEGFRTDQSILSQRKDPDRYPYLTVLDDWLSSIRLYGDWVFGRSAPARSPIPFDYQDESLDEDGRNLSVVLKRLLKNPESAALIHENLQFIYDGISGVRVRETFDQVQFLVSEDEDRLIPASRVSDGTIRFLSLLALLCDPNPPPLVCIEEPELGLHPDVIPRVARLLIDASKRTQLIVTTHSADLISALWETPEAVVVCDRGIEGTTFKRLEPQILKKWLDKYTLGHLWSMGEIGGNR